ncbi:imidazole glycerol phosphate synthase subunit HisH [Melioribacteraceae bacterium 4301-Me]|uniref:imidazole glycerol phosphate synthase subunit HisH n=1 Tax=Pyranulibacter aquaticus TaxID=3163344 RepID=UPI003596359C
MIAIIDYGDGTCKLVSDILSKYKIENKITNTESEIAKADKIIFSGIGPAIFAAKKLHLLNLFSMFRIIKKPFLGIGLGMQLLCEKSKEGDVVGLGIIPVTAEKFDGSKVKVPQSGKNKVKQIKECKLFKGIKDNELFEYTNSYYVPINEYTVATSVYDVEFSAAVQKENYYGVQFHPELNGEVGQKLLMNFINL